MIWFTADEHYGHANIIKYCLRPFSDVHEMNKELTRRHNSVVKNGDTVYHIGDFSFRDRPRYAAKLNGKHIFLRGNHDHAKKDLPYMIEVSINGQLIVLCHYAMRAWNKGHHGSWHLYGHSHGTIPDYGKSMDVGVDTNYYYPYSFDQIVQIMVQKAETYNSFVNLPGVLAGVIKE